MKKQFFALFILIFSNILLFAQIPNNIWAYSTGGASVDQGNSIITDFFGNVYYTGVFKSTSITFGSITLNNAGNNDIFIAKYNIHGNVVWAKSAGGSEDDFGNCITVDSKGNVYLAGAFKSSSITFGSTTLTNSGNNTQYLFIAKYDSSGNVLWAKSIDGSSEDVANSIKTDKSGNVLLTGSFQSASITFGSVTLTNSGSNTRDIFIAKYDSSGNALWAKSEGGVSNEEGSGITTDNFCNIYITGYFNSSSFAIGSATLTNAGSSDIFIAKYDSSGNALWAKSSGGTSMDFGMSVTTDGSDNVCITGWFGSPEIILGSDTLLNAGSYDVFITKYDSLGNVLWAKRAGGSEGDVANSIYLDSYGNFNLVGSFTSTSIIFGNNTLINTGGSDIFIAKYDSSGNALWAKRAGGSTDDNGYCIAIDNYDNEYITGIFKSMSIAFGNDILNNAGSGDAFIAKLSIADNNGPLCVGSSLLLSASTLAGATYSWSGPNGYISSLQNPVILNSAVTMTGIYFVTVSIGGNAIASGSTDVIIKFMPSTPIVGNNGPVCVGNTLSLTAFSDSATTYSWSGPNGFISSIQNPIVNINATIAMNGSYNVYASLNGCTSPLGSTTATVDTIPSAIITPSGNISLCAGDSIILTSNIAYNYLWCDSSTYQSITVLDSGSYTVTVSNSLGCSATSFATIITVNDNPAIPTITMTGDSLFSSVASTYQWYLNDTIINGAELLYYLPLENGNYTVEITDSNGCSAISSVFNYFYVSVNEIDKENLIKIFPNPTSSGFTITITPETQYVQISNSLDQLVDNIIVNGQNNLYIELFDRGIYYIKIVTAKHVITKKIIVAE